MEKTKENTSKTKYVYVKDSEGIEYICRAEDLKRTDKLTEEEKAGCMAPPGDG